MAMASRLIPVVVLLLFGLVAPLVGCSLAGLGDAYYEKLVGPYILVAVDTRDQLTVSRAEGDGVSSGRIGPTVTAAGWNNRYVVAATRPKKRPGESESYYILDITKDVAVGDQFAAVIGPLSWEEFAKLKAELGLPDFVRVFPDLR
jgi:hypothetical protein